MKHRLQALALALALILGLFLGTAAPSHAQLEGGYLPMPDLHIGTTSIYQDTAIGKWKLSVEVKNIGDADSRACTLSLNLHSGNISTLPNGVQIEAVYIYTVSVPALSRGGKTTVIINLGSSYPTGQWGVLKVDCYNEVIEKHPQRPLAEANNTKNVYF
jgi:hypothetical protein